MVLCKKEWKWKYSSSDTAVFRKLWSIKLCYILILQLIVVIYSIWRFLIIKMHIIEPWLATQNQKVQNLLVGALLWNCIRLRYVMIHFLDVIFFQLQVRNWKFHACNLDKDVFSAALPELYVCECNSHSVFQQDPRPATS